jgi:hypothetical protein
MVLFFIDIGSLLDAIQDLATNSTAANTADSRIDEASPSVAIIQDGEDVISIENDQGTAIANTGSIGNGGDGGDGSAAIILG